MIDTQTFATVLIAILTPILGGYGAVWVYFQKQQAKIIELLEKQITDRDDTIARLLKERNVYQGLAWDALEGTKRSTENTHRALSLTDKLQKAQSAD